MGLLGTYARLDVDLVKGEGAYAYDIHGKKYLDFCSGIAVNALGHCHPHLVQTIQQQSQKIWHTSNVFSASQAEEAADVICASTDFAKHAFLCNSGAEAVEGTIKTIRKYFHDKGKPHKNRIITMSGAFHGRTIATISAAGKGTEGFAPLLDGFDHAIFNDLDSVKSLISENTAAILLEPIQGEGGVVAATADFIQGVEKLARDNGLVLAVDEIQAGAGRTGFVWSHQSYGVTPDIMAVAKGIGGGFPVGAFVMTDALAQGMVPGTHGSTYGGNPMAAAIIITMFKYLTDSKFLQSVTATGAYFNHQLSMLSNRYTVRQYGLFIGLQFEQSIDNAVVFKLLTKHGLLCVRGADNTIRLLPPLNITTAHVDEAIAILQKVLNEVA